VIHPRSYTSALQVCDRRHAVHDFARAPLPLQCTCWPQIITSSTLLPYDTLSAANPIHPSPHTTRTSYPSAPAQLSPATPQHLSQLRHLDLGAGHDVSECHSLLLIDGINSSSAAAPLYAQWQRNIAELQRR
jgi:hypothetical protein